MEILEEKLEYFKGILDISRDMQGYYEEEKYEEIKNLLNDRWVLISKVNELEEGRDRSEAEKLKDNDGNLDEITKKLLFELKITLENIKDADKEIRERIIAKKESVESEIATLVDGKRKISNYRQGEDIEYSLDIVQ